jgi:hypothetical protein
VNSGTSTYENSAQRLRERSTAFHSTVEIDGENSSEVWSSFRVARRARPFDLKIDDQLPRLLVASAAHDGYRRLPGKPVHRRRWQLTTHALGVRDQIEGEFRAAIARYHLGKGVAATVSANGCSGVIRTADGRTIHFGSSLPVSIEPSEWHPEFGLSIPIECLTIPMIAKELEIEFSW